MRFGEKYSKDILTVSEVSGYLRIHPTTLYRLLKKGQLPAFKIGNDWRISVKAVDKWLKEMQTRGSKPGAGEGQSGGLSLRHSRSPKSRGQKSRA
jgi:excisionase family DNA binding protein